MAEKALTPREKRVRKHNASTLIALISFAAMAGVATFAGQDGQPFRIAFALVFGIAILIMFRSRNADEYSAAIWRTGTSMAFVVTVAFMLFVPALEGFFDGLFDMPSKQDIDTDSLLPFVAIASFFLANLLARIRGTF